MAQTFATPSHFTKPTKREFSLNHEFEVLEGSHPPFTSRDQGHTFRNYPSHYGFSIKDLEEGIYPAKCSLTDLAYFVQEWLFFGLAIGIAELPKLALASVDMTFEGPDGRQYLTITTIPFIMRCWIASETLMYGPDEAEDRLQVATSYLNSARAISSVLEAHATSIVAGFGPSSQGRKACLVLQRTLLACVLLQQELIKLLRRVYTGYSFLGQSVRFNDDGKVTRIPYPLAQIRATHQPLVLLRQLCLQAGWCATAIESVAHRSEQYAVTQLFHLSKTQRAAGDHSNCEGVICKSYDLLAWDEHLHSPCDCAFVTTSGIREQVTELALANEMALITVRGSRSKTLSVNIAAPENIEDAPSSSKFSMRGMFRKKSSGGESTQQARPATATSIKPYVVVSYARNVHSGRNAGSSIASCQMERLQARVDALYPTRSRPVPFWLDALCVPPADWSDNISARSALRDRTVTRLREADKVLVVDPEVMNFSAETDPEAALVRIYHCGWSKQFATLPEAVFPDRILFQFKDGAFDIEDLVGQYRKIHYGMLEGAAYGMQDKQMQAAYSRRFRSSIHYMNQFWSYRDRDMGFDFEEKLEQQSENVIVKGLRIVNEMANYSVGSLFETSIDRWKDIRSIRASPSSKDRLVSVARQLAFRSDNSVQDEAFYLSVLLGLHRRIDFGADTQDARELDKRIADIWHIFGLFPTPLIFGSGQRLSIAGLTCAPRSLSGSFDYAQRLTTVDIGLVNRDPPGMTIQLPGFLLQSRKVDIDADQTDLCFREEDVTFRVTLSSPDTAACARTWASVLKEDRPLCLMTARRPENPDRSRTYPAVLVSVTRTASKIMWVRYESAAIVCADSFDVKTVFAAKRLDANTTWHLQ